MIQYVVCNMAIISAGFTLCRAELEFGVACLALYPKRLGLVQDIEMAH